MMVCTKLSESKERKRSPEVQCPKLNYSPQVSEQADINPGSEKMIYIVLSIIRDQRQCTQNVC